MFLTFVGAAGTVTGSKTLVEAGTDGAPFLVDCGLFQGPRDLRARNWEPFPVDPGTVASVVLTHAHLDHCGYLPALVREGFAGPVYCSTNTAALVPIILRDSAKLQEEDAAFARKKGYSRHAQPQALYDADDAERAIALLRPIPFRVDFSPVAGVVAHLEPAGHILGSSVVTIDESATGRRAVFSGDLGRGNHPLLRAPAPPSGAHAIVVESTYGDREHPDVQSEIDEMADIITRTIKRGGTVIIPAFAVDRTEVLLQCLRQLQDQQRIPTVPIHADSPMALTALGIYVKAIEDADPEINSATLSEGPEAIDLPNLHEATTREQSMQLDTPGARIIISASGMASGGRVVHHLKAFLPDPRNSVLLVGYQSVGTAGRLLADGIEQLKIHGQYVPVRAQIASIEAFSVHADCSELIDWLKGCQPPPAQVFCNHGEADSSLALAKRIRAELDVVAVVPRPGERVAV